MVLAMVSSCSSEPANEGPEVASNLAVDNWKPGADWALVWADEFDGDTLDASSWNRQVEPAGRFNEEWQRYTDSEETHSSKKDYLSSRLNMRVIPTG